MKFRKLIGSILLGAVLAFGAVGTSTSTVTYAVDNLEDSFNSSGSESVYSDNGVSDFLKNYNSMTGDQLEGASLALSPITNIFGYIIGGIIALSSGAIFMITAFDLLYISIPPLRGMLYTVGGNKSFQLISDEAVRCSSLIGGGGGANSSSASMGGASFGVQGGMAQPQGQSQGTKSVIVSYFKMRLFFIILFAVSVVILTSSMLLGTGVNIAQWGLKLIEILNNSIPTL